MGLAAAMETIAGICNGAGSFGLWGKSGCRMV
jgi:hypothetical protein